MGVGVVGPLCCVFFSDERMGNDLARNGSPNERVSALLFGCLESLGRRVDGTGSGRSLLMSDFERCFPLELWSND